MSFEPGEYSCSLTVWRCASGEVMRAFGETSRDLNWKHLGKNLPARLAGVSIRTSVLAQYLLRN
jgi:hypothetical protein